MRILPMIVVSFYLSTAHAESVLIQEGSEIKRVNSHEFDDGQLPKIEQWQIRLYKKGQQTGGADYWGLLIGSSQAEVLFELRADKETQRHIAAGMNLDYRDDVYTYYNTLGPIGILKPQSTTKKLLELKDQITNLVDLYNFVTHQPNNKEALPADVGSIAMEYGKVLFDAKLNLSKLTRELILTSNSNSDDITSLITEIARPIEMASNSSGAAASLLNYSKKDKVNLQYLIVILNKIESLEYELVSKSENWERSNEELDELLIKKGNILRSITAEKTNSRKYKKLLNEKEQLDQEIERMIADNDRMYNENVEGIQSELDIYFRDLGVITEHCSLEQSNQIHQATEHYIQIQDSLHALAEKSADRTNDLYIEYKSKYEKRKSHENQIDMERFANSKRHADQKVDAIFKYIAILKALRNATRSISISYPSESYITDREDKIPTATQYNPNQNSDGGTGQGVVGGTIPSHGNGPPRAIPAR